MLKLYDGALSSIILRIFPFSETPPSFERFPESLRKLFKEREGFASGIYVTVSKGERTTTRLTIPIPIPTNKRIELSVDLKEMKVESDWDTIVLATNKLSNLPIPGNALNVVTDDLKIFAHVGETSEVLPNYMWVCRTYACIYDLEKDRLTYFAESEIPADPYSQIYLVKTKWVRRGERTRKYYAFSKRPEWLYPFSEVVHVDYETNRIYYDDEKANDVVKLWDYLRGKNVTPSEDVQARVIDEITQNGKSFEWGVKYFESYIRRFKKQHAIKQNVKHLTQVLLEKGHVNVNDYDLLYLPLPIVVVVKRGKLQGVYAVDQEYVEKNGFKKFEKIVSLAIRGKLDNSDNVRDKYLRTVDLVETIKSFLDRVERHDYARIVTRQTRKTSMDA